VIERESPLRIAQLSGHDLDVNSYSIKQKPVAHVAVSKGSHSQFDLLLLRRWRPAAINSTTPFSTRLILAKAAVYRKLAPDD
jgi:hypothetical protein